MRPNDSFGAAASYSHISPEVSESDADAAFFTSAALPVRDYEIDFELTYQAQIVPGFLVQPVFSYVFHPGGGAIDPINPAVGRIPDAAVFGIRTTIKF
jgi:porin